MRSNSSSIFGLCLFALVVQSQAANKVGNGGDGIFCKNGNRVTGQLLDFFETSLRFPIKKAGAEKIAEEQLNLLKTAAPKLAAQYLDRLKSMSKEMEFRKNITLTDVQDSKHLFQPLQKNCKLQQIVIRRGPGWKEGKPFQVRLDLWNVLAPLDQAGLLTHEIIYEHLAKLGEEDSVKVRQLNRALYATSIEREAFWKFIKKLELPIYP